jgi:hypothetical protein
MILANGDQLRINDIEHKYKIDDEILEQIHAKTLED